MMVRSKFINSFKNFWSAARGTAGAEFVLILPLLVLFLFGSIELGRILRDYHVITESVRGAARYLARVPVTCGGADCSSCFFDNAGDVNAAKALVMTGDTAVSPSPNLLGYFSNPSDVVIELSAINNAALPDPFEGLYSGQTCVPHVNVTAKVLFTFLFGELVTPDGTITFDINHIEINVALGL